MNTTITFTQDHSMFVDWAVPFCGKRSTFAFSLPIDLEYNKTYYKYDNDKITAFRILAWAVYKNYVYSSLAYLVQLPNEEPKWINNFIQSNSIIFTSKEQYFDYLVDSRNKHKFNWVSIYDVLDTKYKQTTYSGACELEFKNVLWYWSNDKGCPLSTSVYVEYFFGTENGIFIGAQKYGCNTTYYMSKEECIKANVNGLVISDFAEEPIKVTINILPNQPKIHTLRFIEE